MNYITQTENNVREETKKMDGYRSDRTKIQQDIQHIQGLKGRIRMATDRINQMETERTSIDDIKAVCNKDIKVFFINITHTKNLCLAESAYIFNNFLCIGYFKETTANVQRIYHNPEGTF